MPFDRPILSNLRSQVATDINADLVSSGADALPRYSNFGILGDALAALANGHYGYLDWIARQCVPFTATDEFLEGWAALKNVIRKPAEAASGTAMFPATPDATVPAGTLLVRSDGFNYASTAEVTATGNTIEVPFVAVTPGAAGDSVSGIALTLGVGVSGVGSSGAAVAAIAGGADVEQDDALRTRMLAAYAAPAQGGSSADYVNWALAVAGVTRAWPARTMGLGTVTVFFMMDDVRSAEGGFPQGSNGVATDEDRDVAATGDQLLVANALFVVQPVTPIVYAVAPAANALTLTIAGISGASAGVKAAIAAAVRIALVIGAEPGGTTNVSLIEAAIAGVGGAAGFVLTNIAATAGTVSPGAAGNIVSDNGHIATLAGVTYV